MSDKELLRVARESGYFQKALPHLDAAIREMPGNSGGLRIIEEMNACRAKIKNRIAELEAVMDAAGLEVMP